MSAAGNKGTSIIPPNGRELEFRVFINGGGYPEHRDHKLQIGDSCVQRSSISDLNLRF